MATKPKAQTTKNSASALDPRTLICIEELEQLIAIAKTGKQRLFISGVSTGPGGDVAVTIGSYGQPGDPIGTALYKSLNEAWRKQRV